MILDVFFKIAVPVAIGGMVFAKLMIARNNARPFYSGAEGAARRDAINQRYQTNKAAIVIAILFVPIYGLVVAGLIEEWGPKFFTFVISALLLLPTMVVYSVVLMIYCFAVHGVAGRR